MPWQEQTVEEQRTEFIALARRDDANIRELCRRFGISPKTGYKWLGRAATEGEAGLRDRSRRPHHSPNQTDPAVEARVVAARTAHPTWGARKLRAWLLRGGDGDGDGGSIGDSVDASSVPSTSTITAILGRHGLIDPQESARRQPFTRFEHPHPNDLWQMDFMGHLALGTGRVHPLCVIDDHSRYVLGVRACAEERTETVQPALMAVFRRYGLPWAILTDNGPPWGVPGHPDALTRLEVWLLRLDVALWHGRPAHPQTQGKVERLHRTIARDVLRPYQYPDLATCQAGLDAWRTTYNQHRPHEALDLAVPAERYTVSVRPFPDPLPPIEYDEGTIVRRVAAKGDIRYRSGRYFIAEALAGEWVAISPTPKEGCWQVSYGCHRITTIDERQRAE